MANSTITPLIDFNRQLITSQRQLLDNMEQLLNAWPIDVRTDAGAGGARGAATPRKRTARGRTRAGGGRGAAAAATGTAR